MVLKTYRQSIVKSEYKRSEEINFDWNSNLHSLLIYPPSSILKIANKQF